MLGHLEHPMVLSFFIFLYTWVCNRTVQKPVVLTLRDQSSEQEKG